MNENTNEMKPKICAKTDKGEWVELNKLAAGQDLTLSSPWMILYHKIEALFEQDSDVCVAWDEDSKTIKVIVDRSQMEKQIALMKLLPREKQFGNITVKIEIVSDTEPDLATLIEMAFDGNLALSDIKTHELFNFLYVVFQPKVVQFYADELMTLDGFESTLYQEIAKDVFELPNVFYSTARV